MLDGKADVLTFAGQVMKNVAGYDVARVMAGALGVLGVLLEVSLKVMLKPPASSTLAFDVAEAEALTLLGVWGGHQSLSSSESLRASRFSGDHFAFWLTCVVSHAS